MNMGQRSAPLEYFYQLPIECHEQGKKSNNFKSHIKMSDS